MQTIEPLKRKIKSAGENAGRFASIQATERNIEDLPEELNSQFQQQRQSSITKNMKTHFFIYVWTFYILKQGNRVAVFYADTVGSLHSYCN
jgi:hypothetical protein